MVVAVGLVPWAIALNAVLPDREVVRNWDIAWSGFDIALAGALAAVAIAALRGSRWVSHLAVVAGTLLVCDAWFDVVTARGETDVGLAVAGLAAELPLAVLCFALALRTARPAEG